MALQNWWTYAVTGPNGVGGERGVDLAMPVGTPIYAPYGGIVLGRTDYANATDKGAVWGQNSKPAYYSQTGYNFWGGEADILSPVPGLGNMVQYFLHLDKLVVTPGQTLSPGQLIGYSGGQNSNTTSDVVPGYTPTHTASPAFSSGPHIEWGLYHGPWQSNVDPTPFLAQLRTNGAAYGLGPGVGTQTGGGNLLSGDILSGAASGLFGSGLDIPGAEQAVKSGLERVGLVYFGSLLILVGVLVLFFSSQSGQAVTQDATHTAGTAALVAA